MIETYLVRLKKPTRRKHRMWLEEQREYANAINWCVEQISNGETLTSKHVKFNLKSAIKNEAIRRARKAVNDVKKGLAKKKPFFRSTTPISINNQNWNTLKKGNRWYIGFTSNEGRKYLPVFETNWVKTYFPFFRKREFRGTIQLLRKGKEWYLAIPVQMASSIEIKPSDNPTYIGVDLGLRHIAVVGEPITKKRQFFSGKEVGYKRRHFRSLRKSLQKKKALRAVKSLGNKERRWMEDYNRKIAKDIVNFTMQFKDPIIKLEKLDDIRKTTRTLKRADRTIHNWAFYQLKQFIKERALKCNIQVIDIDPAYTSQKCFNCNYIDKKNRNRDKFECRSCSYSNHADLNASYNIALA